MAKSLAESPTGLVHIVRLLPSRVITKCGLEVDKETWTRIRTYDSRMFGQTNSTIARMVELPKCERCFYHF